MKALHIPADLSQQPKVLDLDDNFESGRAAQEIEAILGPLIDPCAYDLDSTMLVAGNGMAEGRPMNRRATRYIKQESDACRQGQMRNVSASYGLYGDVIVLGETPDHGFTDVPQRMIDAFVGLDNTPDLGSLA